MADFGELARKIVQKKFPLLGSFRRLVTYSQTPTAIYDPVERTVDHGTPTDYSLWVVFLNRGPASITGAIQQNDDVQILSIDQKAIFPTADLPVDPKVGDLLTTQDGQVWRVSGVTKDPKPALWSLIVRPIGAGT